MMMMIAAACLTCWRLSAQRRAPLSQARRASAISERGSAPSFTTSFIRRQVVISILPRVSLDILRLFPGLLRFLMQYICLH